MKKNENKAGNKMLELPAFGNLVSYEKTFPLFDELLLD